MDSTRKIRRDGWTAPRRAALLAAVAEGAGIVRAAARAGPSVSSLYRLLARDRDFAAQLDAVFAAREAGQVAPARTPGIAAMTTLDLMRRLTPAARDRALRLEACEIRDLS